MIILLDLRGGALASRIYDFTKHGDPETKSLIDRLLSAAVAPLYATMAKYTRCNTSYCIDSLVSHLRWVMEGVLDDPFR